MHTVGGDRRCLKSSPLLELRVNPRGAPLCTGPQDAFRPLPWRVQTRQRRASSVPQGWPRNHPSPAPCCLLLGPRRLFLEGSQGAAPSRVPGSAVSEQVGRGRGEEGEGGRCSVQPPQGVNRVRRRKPLSSADGECDPRASLAAAAQLRNEKRTLLPSPWPRLTCWSKARGRTCEPRHLCQSLGEVRVHSKGSLMWEELRQSSHGAAPIRGGPSLGPRPCTPCPAQEPFPAGVSSPLHPVFHRPRSCKGREPPSASLAR